MNQQISDKYQVTFQPYGITVEAGCGENLLELARRGGVGITASCGGDGVCGTCKVKIIQGEVDSPPSLQLCNEEISSGFRLACRCRVMSDLIVEVPPESCAPVSEGHLRSLVTSEETLAATGWRFAPPVFKLLLELPQPSLKDNSSDLTRIERELESHGMDIELVNTRSDHGD